MNAPGVKFPGRDIDVFFAGDLVALTYLRVGDCGIEIPAGSYFQRRCQHDLRRHQFGYRALRVGPCRTSNPAFFHRDEINAFKPVAAIDFESLQIFIVDLFEAPETIAHGQMLFLIRHGYIETLAWPFLDQIVIPSCSLSRRQKRRLSRATDQRHYAQGENDDFHLR